MKNLNKINWNTQIKNTQCYTENIKNNSDVPHQRTDLYCLNFFLCAVHFIKLSIELRARVQLKKSTFSQKVDFFSFYLSINREN